MALAFQAVDYRSLEMLRYYDQNPVVGSYGVGIRAVCVCAQKCVEGG